MYDPVNRPNEHIVIGSDGAFSAHRDDPDPFIGQMAKIAEDGKVGYVFPCLDNGQQAMAVWVAGTADGVLAEDLDTADYIQGAVELRDHLGQRAGVSLLVWDKGLEPDGSRARDRERDTDT